MSGNGAEKRFVASCPVCSGALHVTELSCAGCGTQIHSELGVPAFLRLPADLQHFVQVFLACRGNISEVEKRLGISYPTVNKRLDVVNTVLRGGAGASAADPSAEPAGDAAADEAPIVPPARTHRQVLQQLENNEITAQQAARLLKQLGNGAGKESR